MLQPRAFSAMTEVVLGHLVVTVHESSGKNKDDADVWDPSFTEGFVKVEIRGGPRNVKVLSSIKRVHANTISWNEELTLDVLGGANELRLMLCREKKHGARVGTSVVAACGIFVADILEAVPIDKYFELFKPGAGGDGGFIRIGMNYEDTASKPIVANGHEDHLVRTFQPMLSFKSEMSDALGADLLKAVEVKAPGTPDKKHATPLANGIPAAEPPAPKSEKKKKKGRRPIVSFLRASVVLGVVVIGVLKVAGK